LVTFAVGVGSGGVTTPIILTFFNFSFNKSVGLEKAITFSGSFIRYLIDVCKKSPIKGESYKPLIHYEISMLFTPIILSGSIIGVVFN